MGSMMLEDELQVEEGQEEQHVAKVEHYQEEDDWVAVGVHLYAVSGS